MELLQRGLESGYIANGSFDLEFKGGAIHEVGLALDGGHSGGVPANLHDDAPWSILSELELQQGGPRIRANPRSLYHLAAVLSGGYAQRSASLTAGSAFFSRFFLPLNRLVPGCGLDAIASPVSWKGSWRTQAAWSGTAPTSIDSDTRLRTVYYTSDQSPAGGMREPEIVEELVDCGAASLNRERKIDFAKPFVLPGILMLAYDADGVAGASLTDRSLRTDGLARRVSVDLYHPGRGRKVLVDNVTWGTLRANTVRLLGGTADDEAASAGVAWVPLRGFGPYNFEGRLVVPEGTYLVVTIDTSSTPERGFTAITPAAGDVVRCVLPKVHANPKAVTLPQSDVAAAVRAAQARPFRV